MSDVVRLTPEQCAIAKAFPRALMLLHSHNVAIELTLIRMYRAGIKHQLPLPYMAELSAAQCELNDAIWAARGESVLLVRLANEDGPAPITQANPPGETRPAVINQE